MINDNEGCASQSSYSRLTPKLNSISQKNRKFVLPAVELLLAEQEKAERLNQESAIKWPTKLAISFEQGLSPKAAMSNIKIKENPLKTPKIGTHNEITLISRRLSCNANSNKKNVRQEYFNNDIENEKNDHLKVSSRLKIEEVADKESNNKTDEDNKESPKKNICVDTQDFDEILDSSCFDSYQHYMNPRESRQYAHTNFEDKEWKDSGNQEIDPNIKFNTLKEYQKYGSSNQLKSETDNIQFEMSDIKQPTVNISNEAQLIYEYLLSPKGTKTQHIIVRHHNGDLCNNFKDCVSLSENGLVIADECNLKH